ncbi:MAG: hypothetical protein RJQ09_07750 [Cyclobacteriaceae bacterium]
MLRLRLILFVCFIGFGVTESFAQNSREVEVKPQTNLAQNNLQEETLSKRERKKRLKKSYSNYFNQKIDEFEERREAITKRNLKAARKLEKQRNKTTANQYLGHKKAPKKRKIGKRKLCKECHMWH